jgi:hypothetical protein
VHYSFHICLFGGQWTNLKDAKCIKYWGILGWRRTLYQNLSLFWRGRRVVLWAFNFEEVNLSKF